MNSLVLVVEDNKINLYLTTFILEEAGHQVLSATSGAEALELARAQPPALILLDLHIPGVSGFDVAKELRSWSTMRDVPIVAISADAESKSGQAALEAGCNDFIPKPINPDTFIDLLGDHLPEI